MNQCKCDSPYKKLNDNEIVSIGDIISLDPISNRVKLAFNRVNYKDEQVIGICNKIENNLIYVSNTGIVDVNTEGIICIGDKLTTSNNPGKARAIKYDKDESQFNIRSIGKVIGLYNTYNKVKVLLDIE